MSVLAKSPTLPADPVAPSLTPPERWANLAGNDGKTKARLNLDTGELVIKIRGECHKWSLCKVLYKECGASDSITRPTG